MTLKMLWEGCPAFVVEEEEAFFIEATKSEALSSIVPLLSPHEKIKFEQLKDTYIAKASNGFVREGCFYFLISRGAHIIKFESVALMTSNLEDRGGRVKILPDIPIARIEDIDSVDIPKC
jgi:hypothetical protein